MKAIISSYPRSGSTWFRYTLCNLLWPGPVYTFADLDRMIPTLEDEKGLPASQADPVVFHTHSHVVGPKAIHLHRHVGDCLVSEWWYKKKFHDEQRSLLNYLEADGFGEGWRNHVDALLGCYQISYRELDNPKALDRVLTKVGFTFTQMEICLAITRSSFKEMRKLEGNLDVERYCAGDQSIPFVRRGLSDVWRTLADDLRNELLHRNTKQLIALGYGIG